MTDPGPAGRPPTWVERVNARRRVVLSRQRLGRAIMVAAVVAAVTCLIGAVVAWVFLGDLRDRSASSLRLVERTLVNVDETLEVAQDVTATVGESIDTVRATLATVAGSVGDAAAALDAVGDITEDVPPALDRVDDALGRVSAAAEVVDGALGALDALPIGPDLDTDAGLTGSVDAVRDELRPIADDLRRSTATVRDLTARSDELTASLDALQDDLDDLDRSLAASTELLDDYRADATEAVGLTRASLDDLDREVLILRLLGVVLALSIAVGQVAPFHIGRQLARSRPGREISDDPAS